MASSDEFDDEPTGYEAVQIVTLTTTVRRKPGADTNTSLKELSFTTLTSPDEPTHTGVAEVLPLTTIWKPLDSAHCDKSGFVENVADAIRNCLPPHAQNIWEFNGHYSPGICPQDWTLGCTGAGSTINGKTIGRGETVGFCVPKTATDIVCRNDRSKIRFFTTLSQYAFDVDLLPIEVRWRSADLSILETTPNVKEVPAPMTKLSFRYARSGPIDPRFQQHVKGRQLNSGWSDSFADESTASLGEPVNPVQTPPSLSSSSSSSSSPGSHPRSSASNTRSPGSPNVSPTGKPSSDSGSGGLSEGAIAGIAIGIGLLGILTALAVFFIWRRKRRHHAARGGGDPPPGAGGIPELHGNPSTLGGGSPAAAAAGAAEKDSTPISPHLPHELSGVSPTPGPVEIPDTSQPFYTGPGSQELPASPQRAVLPPVTGQQQQQASQQQQQFPYSYMGASPQWQTYQEMPQQQQYYPQQQPQLQELGGQNSPSLPTTTTTITSYPHLPPQELGQNSPAPAPAPAAGIYPQPPPAVATAQQIYAYETTAPEPVVPTSSTPSSSNIAYRVESEQLARLQERRQRLLELDRIDREEEEILRRMSQHPGGSSGGGSGGGRAGDSG